MPRSPANGTSNAFATVTLIESNGARIPITLYPSLTKSTNNRPMFFINPPNCLLKHNETGCLGRKSDVGLDRFGDGCRDHLCVKTCLLYTSPSPRDRTRSRMP